jgi:ketosteroid isomerase-like protein
MSAEDNRELIDHYYRALAAGDADMGRFFSSEAEWHLPRTSPMHGRVKGRSAIASLLSGAGVSDYYRPETMQFERRAIIAAADSVVASFTLRAVTANGHDYENDYCMWFGLRDRLITDVWEYFDTALLFDLIRPD